MTRSQSHTEHVLCVLRGARQRITNARICTLRRVIDSINIFCNARNEQQKAAYYKCRQAINHLCHTAERSRAVIEPQQRAARARSDEEHPL